MLYFALVQKEQESLAEPEPLPQQEGQQGDTEAHRPRAMPQEPHGAAHHICQLLVTDHIHSRVPLTSLWTQDMTIIFTG